MNNKTNKKIEKILDISYELCENEDPDISQKGSLINNNTYEVKKEIAILKRNISTILQNIAKNKNYDLGYIKKSFKKQGITFEE